MLLAPVLSTPYMPVAGLKSLVCDGNSLTAILGQQGGGATSWGGDIPDPFPVQLAAYFQTANSSVVVKNFGVGGQSTANMIADAVTQIDPLISATGGNILTMWEITNQAHGSSTVAQIYDLTRQYCLARRAAGWKVIVFTAVPREGSLGSRNIAQFNQRLNEVNTLVRAGWRDWANALFDVRAMPEFSTMNSTYFLPDKIHLNSLGHQRLTAALIPKLSKVLRR